ncbi:ZW10 interactor, partial [Phalacrocorax carbo]|uniref:ZW10 interactor n=1 Tax=Phalacrocorax carbo TaxID=9209 RepID=UPI00311A34D9
MAEARRERARGALLALEAALALEEEEGDVPARVLVEHVVDTRRKQKLLLTQLRVLRRLLGVIENPGPPPAPPNLREEGARARGRWQQLKWGYGGALGGALPPALAQLGRGRRLLRSLRGVLGGRRRQIAELEAKVREAEGRRDELRRRLEQRREAALRAGAGRRLYERLAGVGVPPLPPPGPPETLPDPRLRRSPGGGVCPLVRGAGGGAGGHWESAGGHWG